MNQEFPGVQTGFRKGRGTRDQIANICWIIKRAREFEKNICFTDYAKAFDCVDHNKLWTILKEMGIPDHLTCLLRNLYAGQEATVRTGHETMDWLQTGKGVHHLTYMQSISHEKCQAGWSSSWNQDYWEKCQQPQICRWYHPYSRKWWGTEEPLDESERGGWKRWLKTQHSKN